MALRFVQVVAFSALVGACVRQPAAAPSERKAVASLDDRARKEACVVAARACIKHLLTGNDEDLVDCMPDDVVRTIGGRDKILAVLRKQNAKWTSEGTRIEDSELDPPAAMEKGGSGSRSFAIVPTRLRMHVRQDRILSRGFLLGVSPDDGRSWRFVDGAQLNDEVAKQLFPDFPPSLTLPTRGKPELVD